jgi:DNA-binding transcriptional LysR family regulator
MKPPLDLDQLQTFITIADTGSFTRAAEEVHRTQSAVSMQMRRLEERIGKPLFEKDGRSNKLSEEGEKLLSYARRMMRLNRETLAAFDDEQSGRPRSASARRTTMPTGSCRRSWRGFARSNPRVELSVICEPTPGLREHIKRGNLDIALVTHNDERAIGGGAARAAALGHLGQPCGARAEAAARGFRPSDLHLAARGLRCARPHGPRISRAVHQLFGHRHHGRCALRPGGLRAAGMRAAARHARAGRGRRFWPIARLQDRHHARPFRPSGPIWSKLWRATLPKAWTTSPCRCPTRPARSTSPPLP